MKFFEIDEEYLKKGGLITRDKKSGLAFGIVNNCLVAFNNGIKKEPTEIFKGYSCDLLADDWEYVGFQQNQKCAPKNGDKFYYITSTGKVSCDNFAMFATYDIDKVKFHNMFENEEEAKNMIEKLKIINRLRELSTINFNDDCNQLHFIISYDSEAKRIHYNVHHFYRESPFEVYFATKEDCENAIKEIGEENLKKYYFDVVE